MSQSDPDATGTAAPAPHKTCPCGHDRTHEYVIEEPIYTGKDYLWMLAGVSTRAVPYARKCALCGFVFETTEAKRPW